MASSYDIPSWAGKAPTGVHLDVMKSSKLTQKLMIDQKRCYLFGRNPHLNDFSIDHGSCSRVHAALVWHKHLDRAFLVDLGSTHGTFIGNMRIESRKPTPLSIGSSFHFGASTRIYTIRSRPQIYGTIKVLDELEKDTFNDVADGELMGLPKSEMELDNLTDFNTAHNRRIMIVPTGESDLKRVSLRRMSKHSVSFDDCDQIINPEDVDPSIGRFRNLISTTIIPKKRPFSDKDSSSDPNNSNKSSRVHDLYGGISDENSTSSHEDSSAASSLWPSSVYGSKLVLNPAPEVVEVLPVAPAPLLTPAAHILQVEQQGSSEPRKKKYAKEMWPGRKSSQSLLLA